MITKSALGSQLPDHCVHGKHIYAGRNFQEVRIEAHMTVTKEILSSFPGIHSLTQGISKCADGRSTKLST